MALRTLQDGIQNRDKVYLLLLEGHYLLGSLFSERRDIWYKVVKYKEGKNVNSKNKFDQWDIIMQNLSDCFLSFSINYPTFFINQLKQTSV